MVAFPKVTVPKKNTAFGMRRQFILSLRTKPGVASTTKKNMEKGVVGLLTEKFLMRRDLINKWTG